jgi:ribosomal protein L7/L12
MVTVVRCPSCGAPLQQALAACPFCKVALAWPGQQATPDASANQGPEVPPDVLQELRNGNKIGAIKAYHTAYKCGLKEAKDFVDRLERQLGMA